MEQLKTKIERLKIVKKRAQEKVVKLTEKRKYQCKLYGGSKKSTVITTPVPSVTTTTVAASRSPSPAAPPSPSKAPITPAKPVNQPSPSPSSTQPIVASNGWSLSGSNIPLLVLGFALLF
jgi:hypothetical protein